MKNILSLLLVFCGLALVSSQKYTVEGTVQDYHDKTMLQNVTVTIGTYSAKTDPSGKFRIRQIPEGSYTLLASHPDCASFSEAIEVNKVIKNFIKRPVNYY